MFLPFVPATDLPTLETITLGGYTLDLQYWLTQDYEDISIAAQELPPLIEWVNSQLHTKFEQRGIQAQKVKTIEARAYFALKGGEFVRKEYAGKMTEDSVKHALALDEGVIEANDQYAIYDAWVRRLSSIQASLQAKLDLVRSAESTRRKVYADKED